MKKLLKDVRPGDWIELAKPNTNGYAGLVDRVERVHFDLHTVTVDTASQSAAISDRSNIEVECPERPPTLELRWDAEHQRWIVGVEDVWNVNNVTLYVDGDLYVKSEEED